MWNRIEINLANLENNFNELKKNLAPGVKFMAVVKSDAYGHGMLPVAKKLSALGTDAFGVNDAEEGVFLRKNGIRKPIVILQGISEGEEKDIVKHNLTPVVYRQEVLKRISKEALKVKKTVPVHLKVDTGMGRFGLLENEVEEFLNNFRELKGVKLEGICSHLSSADEKNKAYTKAQLASFSEIIDKIKDAGFSLKMNHIANSAGLLKYSESQFNMVRPGISLYGSFPSFEKLNFSLKPLMTFKSQILQIKEFPAGWSFSYGRTFSSKKKTLVATVPVGYANGYPRLLSNKGEVLISGKRARVIGNVCMNAMTVDVSSVPGAVVGSEVVLLGQQGKEEISAEEMAKKMGTISYDIYCSFGSRNNRKWLKG